MTAMENLGSLWNSIQAWLFPTLEDELGQLDEKHRQFVSVCELCSPQTYVESYRWVGNGCPPASRLALCKAFIAKAVWDFPSTRDLIDAVRHRPTLRRLCRRPVHSNSFAHSPTTRAAAKNYPSSSDLSNARPWSIFSVAGQVEKAG